MRHVRIRTPRISKLPPSLVPAVRARGRGRAGPLPRRRQAFLDARDALAGRAGARGCGADIVKMEGARG